MIKIILFALIALSVHTLGYAQEITVPDPHFLQALINKGVDTNHDGKIQASEALAVKNLFVAQSEISDLTGIEAFSNLDSLDCSSNQLTMLDLSHNTGLTMVYCSINKLTALDVSKNTRLASLSCSNNKLTSLIVKGDTALRLLDCGFNKLLNFDASFNSKLEVIECYSNMLDTLNLSGNPGLTALYCGNNKIRNLDLSKNVRLTLVDCQFNALSSINLTASTGLISFACYSNLLTSLDLTNNKRLAFLDCGQNLYTSLDLSKNDSLGTADCSQNPNLKYICVKDSIKAKSNIYFIKGNNVKWSESCNIINGVPDSQEDDLVKIYPNPGSESFYLTMRQMADVQVFNINGTEIDRFTNVQQVQFGGNFLPGMYFIRIHFLESNSNRTMKVVKGVSR